MIRLRERTWIGKVVATLTVTLATTIGLVSFTGCGGDGLTLSFTAADVQPSVESYFPINSDDYVDESTAVRAILSDPEVILQSGSDRFALKMAVTVETTDAAVVPLPTPQAPLPGPPITEPLPEPSKPEPVQFKGSVTVSGELDYKPAEAAFYFLKPTVDDVELDGLPPKLDSPVRLVVEQALADYFAKNSVYTLPDDDVKTEAAKLVLKSLTVEDGKLIVVLGP